MKSRQVGDKVVVHIDVSNLNFSEAGTLKARVQSVLDSTPTQTIVLDFARVEFVDSVGIGAIVALAVSMRKKGGEVRIAGTTSIVKTAMEAVNLQEMVVFYPDLEMALGS